MQAFNQPKDNRPLKQQRKEARLSITTCADSEMAKLLHLRAGMSDAERISALKTDPDIPATILQAYSHDGHEIEAVVTASFQLLERIRIAQTSELKQIDQQHTELTNRLYSVLGGHKVSDTQGTMSRSDLQDNYTIKKNALANILRRIHACWYRAIGMGALGLLLLAGDLVLLYQNIATLLAASGSEDATLILASLVSTLIVVFLLLLLTHLGLAPLFRRAQELMQRDAQGTASPSNRPISGIGRGALLIMLGSTALTFVISYCVAAMRAVITVAEGSDLLFVVLSTLGLPVMNLFIHLCFMASHKHWMEASNMRGEYLDAKQDLREADRELVRVEIQHRRAKPITRQLERVEQKHRKALITAHRRAKSNPSVRSEINRLAELLVSPEAQTSQASHNKSTPLSI